MAEYNFPLHCSVNYSKYKPRSRSNSRVTSYNNTQESFTVFFTLQQVECEEDASREG